MREIVSFVWEKRDFKTAEKLRKRLKRPGISYDKIAIDELCIASVYLLSISVSSGVLPNSPAKSMPGSQLMYSFGIMDKARFHRKKALQEICEKV